MMRGEGCAGLLGVARHQVGFLFPGQERGRNLVNRGGGFM